MSFSRSTKTGLFLIGIASAAIISTPAMSATTYSDRSAFESTLVTGVTPAYQNPSPEYVPHTGDTMTFATGSTVTSTPSFLDAGSTYHWICGCMTLINIEAIDIPIIQEPHPISAVPLPAALPLYGAGIALMGFIGWRKRRAA